MTYYKRINLEGEEINSTYIESSLKTLTAMSVSELKVGDLQSLSVEGHNHGLYFFY